MIDRAIDFFCRLLSNCLHAMANHWILTIVGVVAFVVFMPVWIKWFYSDLGYILWRLSGGLGRALRRSGKKTLVDHFGLSDPHPLDVEFSRKFFMNFERIPDGEGSDHVVLGETAVLFGEGSPRNDPELKAMNVTFKRVFPVNPRRMRRGCCGTYSLAKSLYLGETYGGDPVCGGGLKYFTARWLLMVFEYMRLRSVFRRKSLSAYAPVFHGDKRVSGIFYHHHKDEPGHGYLTVFLGDESIVTEFARRHEMELKPIQICFA